MRPTLSLALLARDEARSLPGAIESARPWVDEIVVRDTGSRDATIATAFELGARVVRGAWHDDFSQARNLLIEAATCAWVLVLDADERLEQGGAEIAALLATPGSSAWSVEIESPVGFGRSERTRAVRLFRRAPGVRYQHRAHEVLEGAGNASPAPITLRHQGWMPSRRQAKSRRNLALLELELEERPGDPYLLWRRGRELDLLGREEEGQRSRLLMADSLRSCDGMTIARCDWAPDAVADWAQDLEHAGRGQDALGLATRVSLAHPLRPLARFLHARALVAAGRRDDAACATASLLRDQNWSIASSEDAAILGQHARALADAIGPAGRGEALTCRP